jgi:hypothetical protein
MHELNNGRVPETVLNLRMFPAWNLFSRTGLLQQKRATPTRAVLLDEFQVSLFSNTGIVFPFRLV